MKAVIMAGGEGTRLRPLTCIYPKPMANICGLPIMSHILALLSRHGFTKAAATLLYMPDKIQEYFGEESAGIKLSYFEETTPLGTAGSVKNCQSFLDGDFLVISGDSLCDLDLTAAVNFHKTRNADVTLILYRVDNPLEYGVTLVNKDGDVTGFIEKPSWSNAFSDTVNTGIYIFKNECLSLIPDNKPFDFAKDLFPLMMNTGKRLCGYIAEGYWNDIGSSTAYLTSSISLMDGRVNCFIPYPEKTAGIYSGSEIPDNVKIFAPSVIGKDVEISAGAVIGPHAFLADGVSLGEQAGVKRSVILPHAKIGAGSQLRGSIVCERAVLKERVSSYEGAVIGSETIVGKDSEIMQNIRIWPQKQIKEKSFVRQNIVWGTGYEGLFDEEGVTGDFGLELTPEYAARLGAAVAFVKKGVLLAAYEGENDAALLADALCAGIRSAGQSSCLSSRLPVSLMRFGCHRFGFSAGLHIQSMDNKTVIRLFDGDGFPLCREDERKIENAFQRDDYRRAKAADIKPLQMLDGIDLLYKRELEKACGSLNPIEVAFAKQDALSTLLSNTAQKAGCIIKDRPSKGVICFDADGAVGSLAVWDEKGLYQGPEKVTALLAKLLFERNEPVYLPFEAPLTIDDSVVKGSFVIRVLPEDNIAREGYALCPAVFDAGFAMAEILKAKNNTDLSELFNGLPSFGVAATILEAKTNKGAVMRQLSSQSDDKEMKKGVRLKMENGNVLIVPMRQKQGFFISAESYSTEAAKELCADISNRINLYEKDNE